MDSDISASTSSNGRCKTAYSFSEGDTVGWGLNIETKTMFFTKNGELLDFTAPFLESNPVSHWKASGDGVFDMNRKIELADIDSRNAIDAMIHAGKCPLRPIIKSVMCVPRTELPADENEYPLAFTLNTGQSDFLFSPQEWEHTRNASHEVALPALIRPDRCNLPSHLRSQGSQFGGSRKVRNTYVEASLAVSE